MDRPMSQGFTLIELMIVLAVLGILVAVALPTYQDFSVRAKNAECLNVASAAKTAVGEGLHRVSGGSLNSGYEWGGSTPYCSSIAINESGVITATTQGTGADPLAIFELEPHHDGARVDWTCRETAGASTAQIPSNCRE